MTGYIKKVFGRKNVKKPLGPRVFQGKLKGFTEPGKPSMVGRGGFEPPKSLTTDLQSVPFGRSGIFPYIQLLCNGGPSGTRTQDQPVMSREL